MWTSLVISWSNFLRRFFYGENYWCRSWTDRSCSALWSYFLRWRNRTPSFSWWSSKEHDWGLKKANPIAFAFLKTTDSTELISNSMGGHFPLCSIPGRFRPIKSQNKIHTQHQARRLPWLWGLCPEMLAKLVTFQKGSKTPASKLTPSQQKDWLVDMRSLYRQLERA